MQTKHLGRTGLQISRLCLGTMNFGPRTTEADAFAIMDKALELGVFFFDTANGYGGKPFEGVTESIIGRWFELGGGRREKVVLATKVYGKMGEGPNDRGVSAYHIRRACDESLRRLRTDHIDLYQMHHIDRATPWDELWQAMDTLVTQGKVVYVGSSNFAAWNIATANQVAKGRHSLGLVSEQSKYSLACRHIELEVLPACRYYGVGVIPWSPLGGGLLGGVLDGEPTDKNRRASDSMKKEIAKHHAQLVQWEQLCKDLGEDPANVALAWMLQVPGVDAPIIGPRTMDHLLRTIRATEITLSPDTLKQIDTIWPGPGNQAPEAYAW